MLSRIVAGLLPVVPRPIVGKVAGRYVAGETMEDALETAGRLARSGYASTVDVLGEDIERLDQADEAVEEYLRLIRAQAAAGVDRNVSVKLTAFGLRLDEEHAFAGLRRVLEAAGEHDTFVRIDMEDSSVTDVTLDFHRRAREIWPRVGVVLQARLRRTLDDARRLAAEGASVRLCKGIYPEPASIAHTDHQEIRDAFLDALDILLAGGATVGIATHDPPLYESALTTLGENPADPLRAEFQALLGVPMGAALKRMRDAGHTVRIYVPFGEHWYAYSLRRLRENPAVAGAVMRGLLSRDNLELDG